MNNYKVCVYAICKNEEKFIEKWYNSIKEADYICVLDTGSNDNSVKKFKELGIEVKKKIINPWRFDIARNESLKIIPKDTDICICLDLDEVMLPGWKDELLKIWNKNITRIKYLYNWKLDKNNKPLISFYADKIHAYNKYIWTHPVHEVLKPISFENIIQTDKIIINHYPDQTKSRSSYLKLLELSVKEDPNDDRNLHYLGREYMYYHKWNKCIDTLIKHLNLKTSTWKDERAASMRFIARSYIALKRYNEAIMWYKKAILEAPYLKEAYIIDEVKPYSSKTKSELKYYYKIYNADVSFNSIRCIDNRYDLTHNLENIVYNELIYMGYNVNVYYNGNYEIDFLAQNDGKKYYIQVAYSVENDKAYDREFRAFSNLDYSCKKILITNDDLDYSTSTVIHLKFKDFILMKDLSQI